MNGFDITPFWEINSCRSCGSKRLTEILNFGNVYVSSFLESGEEGFKAPLELVLCEECKLLQLRYTVNPELLYRKYWYKSSVNETMKLHLENLVAKTLEYVKLKPWDVVVDIGANDGTLLRFLPENVTRIGFEPAFNLRREARKGGNIIISDFFSSEKYKEWMGGDESMVKPKIIFCIAMFYDLDNPNKFLEDVKQILAEDGIFIIEQRYLPKMLEQNDIGNICHEHLEYYSLLSLKPLLERHGLEIFGTETNLVNGGSFRVYVKHKGASMFSSRETKDRLLSLMYCEYSFGLDGKKAYLDFATTVESVKHEVHNFVKLKHKEGKIIHVYGASTKGNTILQYFGLDNTLIEAAAERDPRKYGKRTVGTHIPIVSEEESRRRADYYLVLIWHFREAVIKREQKFLESGGKLIFPLPKFEVVVKYEVVEGL